MCQDACLVFSAVFYQDGEVTAETTGQPVPSFPPWPTPNEEEGGVVIPCKYFIDLMKFKNYC
jgi:hypothetical protein